MKPPPEKSSRRRVWGRSGSGYLVMVCLLSCVLLAINGAIVSAASGWLLKPVERLAQMTPRSLNAVKLAQILVFVLPVLLVFVEWALADWIVDRVTRNERPERRR